ncbi:protein of unknown function [Burkholderia multivorans]
MPARRSPHRARPGGATLVAAFAGAVAAPLPAGIQQVVQRRFLAREPLDQEVAQRAHARRMARRSRARARQGARRAAAASFAALVVTWLAARLDAGGPAWSAAATAQWRVAKRIPLRC